jgi:hypothetical protein
MEKHGVGQVLSHWTWLPTLGKQFAKSGRRFFNSGGQTIIRFHPFDALVDTMLNPVMVEEAAELMWEAVDNNIQINIIVNNRAGGNAPLVGRHIAMRFIEMGDTG